MFAYCNNNPVCNSDPNGDLLFTILGAAIGGIAGAVDALICGEDPGKGFLAGAASGGIAGAGVDIGILVTAGTGGAGIGLGLGIAGLFGSAGSIVGTGISTDWQADPMDYLAAGLVGGLCNMVSFGLSPINGEIMSGTVKEMTEFIFIDGTRNLAENMVTGTMIATGGTWITRVVTRNYSFTQERKAIGDRNWKKATLY